MTDAVILYITTSNSDEAHDIGNRVVQERLAACANIFDGMRSIYHWEGRLCEETESVLLLKTRRELLEKLTARVRELHSYACPCIVALPIVGGNPDYLTWINKETGTSPTRT